MKNKKRLKKIKQKLRNKKSIRLKCKKCKKIYIIRVNNKEIYTDKVRKNWTCLFCKS